MSLTELQLQIPRFRIRSRLKQRATFFPACNGAAKRIAWIPMVRALRKLHFWCFHKVKTLEMVKSTHINAVRTAISNHRGGYRGAHSWWCLRPDGGCREKHVFGTHRRVCSVWIRNGDYKGITKEYWTCSFGGWFQTCWTSVQRGMMTPQC